MRLLHADFGAAFLALSFYVINFAKAQNKTEASFGWLMKMHNIHRVENFSKISMDETCQAHMDLYSEGLKQGKMWAVQMFDSNGRYSSQFFFGNDFWLGSQTLCNELSKSKLPPYPLSFHVARLKVKLSIDLTPKGRDVLLGICFPASCSSEDITKILNYQFEDALSEKESHLTVVKVRPVPGSYRIFEDKRFLILGSTVLLTIFFMISGTFIEFISNWKKKNEVQSVEEPIEKNTSDMDNNNGEKSFRHSESKNEMKIYTVMGKEIQKGQKVEKARNPFKNFVCQFFLAFSVLSNGTKILSCHKNSEDSLDSVHGLRFFSLAWVILVHTYLQIFSIGKNKGLRAVTEKSFAYQIVGNGTYSVDSFFIISGLLVSYLFFKTNKEEKTRSPWQMIRKFVTLILYRFLRLTPVYIVVLGMVHLTMVFLKNISVFETPLIVQLNCDSFWWRNILYINNFYPKTEMCMLWSWYMAVDTQFFVLSAILLLFAQKYLRLSGFFMFCLLISSWCTTAYIAYVNKFQVEVQKPLILFDELYDKPWTRLGPYVVGLCAGWLLSKKNCKISIPVPVVLLGWLLSLGGLLGLVFCIGNGFGVIESSIYAALGHTAWGLSLAWIVVSCRCGYGGWINSLLSWPAFFPFSRLTYCAYLVHPMIMFLTNYLMDGPFHMHNGVLVIIFLGNLISSYLLSFILCLAFEAPFIRLLKLVLSPHSER